jgi:hypothetical protein
MHELGVNYFNDRVELAALKFRNHILSMPDGRFTKRIYMALLRERKGTANRRNGALICEALAKSANWVQPIGKSALESASKKFLLSKRNETFALDLVSKSTLSNLKNWTDSSSKSMPEYLLQRCPLGLRAGRRAKVQIRLGCHELNSSSARKIPGNFASKQAASKCSCCDQDVPETAKHSILECPAYAPQRAEFIGRVVDVHDGFSRMGSSARMNFLLSDDTPVSVSSRFYRFLINLLRVRECRLAKLTARGVGPRALTTTLTGGSSS